MSIYIPKNHLKFQGTMKGLLPDQLKALNCEIILGNTYHLGNRPGTEVLKKAGGLHKFMGWERALLTDSGGFQMVSLLKLAQITEEGVQFKSPYDDTQIMLTPEKSIEIQNCIGNCFPTYSLHCLHSLKSGVTYLMFLLQVQIS